MQFCLKLNISQSGRVQPVVRCHVRIRALGHLKPPPSPLPPCHLSAVTLLDPPPPLVCVQSVYAYRWYSLSRAHVTWPHMEVVEAHSRFLRARTRQARRGHLNLFFPLFFSFSSPCLRQRLPKFGTGPPTVPAMGRLFFCLSLFFILSTPRLRGIRWGERRGGRSPSLRALWVRLTFGSRVSYCRI